MDGDASTVTQRRHARRHSLGVRRRRRVPSRRDSESGARDEPSRCRPARVVHVAVRGRHRASIRDVPSVRRRRKCEFCEARGDGATIGTRLFTSAARGRVVRVDKFSDLLHRMR